MKEPLYQKLARAIDAYHRCVKTGNEYADIWEETIEKLAYYLPSGSGFDAGTKIDLTASTGERIILLISYHHMNEAGGYDGWSEHTVIVTPSLVFGFSLRITGRDRDDWKDYAHGVFHSALSEEVDNVAK